MTSGDEIGGEKRRGRRLKKEGMKQRGSRRRIEERKMDNERERMEGAERGVTIQKDRGEAKRAGGAEG